MKKDSTTHTFPKFLFLNIILFFLISEFTFICFGNDNSIQKNTQLIHLETKIINEIRMSYQLDHSLDENYEILKELKNEVSESVKAPNETIILESLKQELLKKENQNQEVEILNNLKSSLIKNQNFDSETEELLVLKEELLKNQNTELQIESLIDLKQTLNKTSTLDEQTKILSDLKNELLHQNDIQSEVTTIESMKSILNDDIQTIPNSSEIKTSQYLPIEILNLIDITFSQKEDMTEINFVFDSVFPKHFKYYSLSTDTPSQIYFLFHNRIMSKEFPYIYTQLSSVESIQLNHKKNKEGRFLEGIIINLNKKSTYQCQIHHQYFTISIKPS